MNFDVFPKGLVIFYGQGGASRWGARNTKISGPKTCCNPLQDRVKPQVQAFSIGKTSSLKSGHSEIQIVTVIGIRVFYVMVI